jgi:hypothetical protein
MIDTNLTNIKELNENEWMGIEAKAGGEGNNVLRMMR